MRYLEGSDYWVRYIDFPNMASPAVSASNGDGTFTIFINSLFPPDRQQEALAHELRHLEQEHFYRDDLPIRQVERVACGIHDNPPAAVPEPKDPERLRDLIFDHPPGQIALFHSLDSLLHYARQYAAQWRRENAGPHGE